MLGYIQGRGHRHSYGASASGMTPITGETLGSGGYTYQEFRDLQSNATVVVIVAGPNGKINKLATADQAERIKADIQHTRGKWNDLGKNDTPGKAVAKRTTPTAAPRKGAGFLSLVGTAAGATGSDEGAAVSSIISGFQTGGKAAGMTAAAAAAGRFGPGMVEAAGDFIRARRDNPARIERKLAHAKMKLSKAKAKGNKRKIAKWRHKVAMFEAMLERLRAANAETMADTSPAVAGMDDGLPAWALPVGGIALVLAVAAIALRKPA